MRIIHTSAMPMVQTFQGFILFILVGVLLCGCFGSGDDIDRVVVSGTVTYNGEPIADGQIRFVPNYGSKLPISGGPITGGNYTIKMRGGVPVGTHRVEINSFRKLEKRYPDQPEEMVPKEQLLPSKFNEESELEREVPAGRSLTLDFPLSD